MALVTKTPKGTKRASGKRSYKKTETFDVYDGDVQLFRSEPHGKMWQFQMWIPEEKKYLRKSLKTKDFETAVKRGEELYLQTFSDVKTGRKLFGITLKELSDAYIKWREEDVALGNITKGRVVTIKSQMKHFLDYKGYQTKLSELDRNSCYE